MTLTYKPGLDSVKVNQQARCLDQRSSSSEVIDQTHTPHICTNNRLLHLENPGWSLLTKEENQSCISCDSWKWLRYLAETCYGFTLLSHARLWSTQHRSGTLSHCWIDREPWVSLKTCT